ncbi:MAG: gliding motility-associated C-terminal domain-containing protein [Lewinellaceae bacterium]|nr:gliding motility-associated C-terminal domain-containing protein [Lewinellaceae bacterium]
MVKFLPLWLVAAFVVVLSNASFGQCNFPFPPGTGAQACQNAPTFCSTADMDNYCSSTGPTGVGPCPGPFCSGCQNYNWFAFVAGTSTLSIEIVPSNCSNGDGLQAEMYQTNDCINFTSVSNCETPGSPVPITVTANALVPGQTYYLMIDGWAAESCDYDLNVLAGSIGSTGPPLITGPISGPTNVCPGASVTYSIPPGTNVGDYDWSLTPAIGAISNDGNNVITITFTSPGTAQLCVTPSNGCATGAPICKTIVSTPIPPQFNYITFCLGDTWTCQGQNFTSPGQQQFVYDSWLGCDSIITCIATALPPIVMPPLQAVICQGQSYNFAGGTYTQTGGYPVTLTAANGCDSVVTLILLVMQADAVINPPPVLGCGSGATIQLNATGSTITPAASNAVLTYSWTGPGIVSGGNTLTPTVNAPGTYTLTVTQTFMGVTCTDMASVTVTQNTAVPNPPTLTGPLSPCTNAASTYTATPSSSGPAPTGYTWTVTGGTFTNTGNTATVTWTTAGQGSVCVTANNACGASTQVCLTINVGLGPVVPVLVGPTDVCNGDIVYYYLDPVDPNTASYNWTVGGNASFTDLGDSLEVDFSGASDGQICVTGTNPCGTSAQTCLSFTVLNVPAQPTITGIASVCDGEIATYSVAADPNATSYNWTVPAGATITAGAGTNSITIDWTGSNNGNVCVRAVNACGQSPQSCFAVTVNDAPTAVLSGGGDFCAGSGETIDLTIDLTGTAPWDITYAINGVPQPTLVGVTTDPYILTTDIPGDYTLVSLDNIAPCPGLVSGSATITENPLPSAVLSGNGSICQGSGDCVSLTILMTGTAPWSVELLLNGNVQAPITGITDNPYTYQACQGGTYGIATVTDANGCVEVGSGSSVVTVNTAPTVSNIQVECNATSTGYTVSFTINGGAPSSYTVNGSNAGISAGPPYVYTSAEIPNGDGYSFTVDDANGCNPVTVENVQVLCDCTSAVGDLDPTELTACGAGACITASYDPTGEAFDGDDVLQFILHQGSGVTIINEIARSAVPTFCYDAAAGMVYGQTYYISAVVGNDLGGGVVDLNDPCLAVAQGTPVVFYEEPTGVMSGDATICVGDATSLTVTFTGPGPYSISYDNGALVQTVNGINANPYTITVMPALTTTYTLTAVSNGNCVGTASGSAAVSVNQDVVVTNVATACNSTNTQFVVSFEISGGDGTTYTVLPVGSGTLTGSNPAMFESNPIAAGSTYSFQVADINSCNVINVQTTEPVDCACTSGVGEMDLNAIEECGDGPVTATYNAVGQNFDGDDVLEFVLHTGSGNAIEYPILARSDTPTFSFDGSTMSYGVVYYISAIVGSDDGTGSVNDQVDPCLAVAPGTPVTFYAVPTATLGGTQEICIGDNAVLPVQLTGDAPWTLEITNGTTTETITGINSTTYNYTVLSPQATATYTITAMNDEHCDGLISGTATVTVNEPPVNEPAEVTINSTNTGYVVCFKISGGVAPYTVTDGATVWTVDSVFCSNELPCGNGYYFEFDGANGCGPVIVTEPLVECACTTAGGELDPTPLEICGSGPAVVAYDATNQVLDGDDVVDFILHNGNNVPIMMSTTPSFAYSGLLSYGVTYYISARIGNNDGNGNVDPTDPCLVITPGTPVVFHQIPAASLTGGGDFCVGEDVQLEVTITGGIAPWDLTYTNTQGDEVTVTIPVSPYTITVNPSGTTLYSLVEVSDANCVGTNVSGIAAFNEQGQPVGANPVVTPDPTNTFVTVCFTIVGGDPLTYSVTGGPGTITGNQFCSDPIPCDVQAYQFFIQDGYGCGLDTLEGTYICNCVSGAGVMDQNALEACAFESVSGTPAVATQLDGNDVLEYVLHTGSGTSLGIVVAVSDTPDFTFDPATMVCNVNYYISSVVGDDDGTGQVDLTDACLSVSEGTPVIFHCLPTAMISGGGPVCLGQSVSATFTMTGGGPFDVVLNDGTQDITLSGIGNGYIWDLTPTQTTTYTLMSVEDVVTGCSNTASGSITVTVNNPVFAGTADVPVELCANVPQVIALADLLTGEDTGGVWTETSAIPSVGGAFNAAAGTFNTAGQAPGTYKFRYFMDGTPPCMDDNETVTVVVHPLPVADAGAAQQLTCDAVAVNVGGSGTSTGPDYSYEWTLAGSPTVIGTDAMLTVSEAGTYQLTVVNTQTGCSTTDQVSVSQNIETPAATIITQDVSCNGYADGLILVESVTGGKPPYMFSFNGAPFSNQQQFSGLSGGDYLLAVQDANGCESQILVNIVEPQELTANLIANIQPDNEGNYIIELGDELNLLLQSSFPIADLDTIIWTPANLVECNDVFCSSVTLAPQEGGLFTVTVNRGPCEASDQLRLLVKIPRPVYIPNIFSPNLDGQNDIFFIQAGKQVQQIRTFQIFNRWGEPVFQADNFLPNDISIGWDGTYRGKDLNPGVYTWFVEVEYVDGYVEILKGDVTLLR